MSKLKILLFMCAVMCSFIASASTIIMPIHAHHGGGMSPKVLLSILIVLNAICLSIALIRSLIWLVKRPDWTYVEYVWYSDWELDTPYINTMSLVMVNGVAVIATLILWVYSVL